MSQIPGAEKKMVAGILGILLGSFGIHKFYLGMQKEGLIMLLVSLGSGEWSPAERRPALWASSG